MTDLAALREALPGWVVWGAALWAPLLHAVIGCGFAWGVDRCNRPDLAGLHWSEQARRVVAGGSLLRHTMVIHAALAGAIAHLTVGPLTPLPHLTHAFVTSGFVWLCCLLVAYRRARWLRPETTPGSYLQGYLFAVVFLYPIVFVTLAMGIAGPAEFGLGFILVYGGGITLMLWLVGGGAITLGRWSRLLEPGDARLQRIVATASARANIEPGRIHLAHTRMANAMAVPATGELVFTTTAVEHLDDDALEAITQHELGHLKEGRESLARRRLVLPFCIAAGMWNPLIHYLTPYGFGAVMVACAMLAFLGVRHAQRMERSADDHAQEHVEAGSPGSYARALEQIYALNLMPAVPRRKLVIHPPLYDRLLAAGVQPDFERPAPPPRQLKQLIVVGSLTLLVLIGEAIGIVYARHQVYRDEVAALRGATVWAGEIHTLAALGYHWQDTAPDRAIAVLRYCNARSERIDVAAQLARVLAPNHADEARQAIAKAERLMAERGVDTQRLRDWIDAAKARLGPGDGRK